VGRSGLVTKDRKPDEIPCLNNKENDQAGSPAKKQAVEEVHNLEKKDSLRKHTAVEGAEEI